MGRRPLGIDLVERMSGPPQAKERLMAVLESLGGEATIEELAKILGVRRTRFYELRDRALEGALAALVEGRRGPRARLVDVRDKELSRLQSENDELRVQLVAERVRTELALVMPQVLRDRTLDHPKGRAKRGGPRKPNGGTTDGSRN
jgi:transposase-like protein